MNKPILSVTLTDQLDGESEAKAIIKDEPVQKLTASGDKAIAHLFKMFGESNTDGRLIISTVAEKTVSIERKGEELSLSIG